MREYNHLPAGFNERIEGFGPEFMAIFLSVLIIIFMPYHPWVEILIVGVTYFIFTSFYALFSNTQSFGKKMAKTEVLTIENKIPPFYILFLRDLFKWSLGISTALLYFVIAFFWMNQRSDKRAPHDLLFKTHVTFKDSKIT